jgi:hypothetical protein
MQAQYCHGDASKPVIVDEAAPASAKWEILRMRWTYRS